MDMNLINLFLANLIALTKVSPTIAVAALVIGFLIFTLHLALTVIGDGVPIFALYVLLALGAFTVITFFIIQAKR